jgi:hypothetical protein
MANFLSFLRKQTDKLLFAQWANGKRIKESRLFPFYLFRLMSPCLHVSRIPQTENRTEEKRQHPFFLETGEGNGELPFVCSKEKRKTDACFPWSANDKR